MRSEKPLNFTERRKYLRIMYHRYQTAGLKERSALLNEMQTVTGLHRKSLIRLMSLPFPPDEKRKPRKKSDN
ncbi:MAG: hypothetical protein WHS87_08710 [Anaerolineales bacterium]